MTRLISSLPGHLQTLAEGRRREYTARTGRVYNSAADQSNLPLRSAFSWMDTLEGHYFWDLVEMHGVIPTALEVEEHRMRIGGEDASSRPMAEVDEDDQIIR